WTEDFPYFPNCDTLIINTSSLSLTYVESNHSKFFNEARRILFDMLMVTNKKIIVIMGGPINWIPIYPFLYEFRSADVKEYDVENYLNSYVSNVKNVKYYITDYNIEYFKFTSYSMSKETYKFIDDIKSFGLGKKNIIKSVGNHTIGGSIICKFFGTNQGGHDYHIYDSGEIIFLPLPSEISPEEGIDILLGDILGTEIREIPPEWTNTVILPNLEETEAKIYELMAEINEKRNEIKHLEDIRLNLIEYRKLLWTKGTPLENIVEDAFKLLGFNEFRKERSDDLEDGIFDFQITSEYEHGVLEIKGSDTRTSLANLTQCNKWVEDYLLEGKQVKGIFIPNQYRLKKYPESQEDREHFEPNEHEYARSRGICIIPAYELFNAVVEKMKNNPEVTRENIEEKILSTNGLCRLVE
ncbi:MAG: hypothetical protein OEW87_15560, partial [Flavobacteriaceae bacterium]|nr:hypothetical protein [Flavobacteriaceae bacterium]